jgi:surfeit locus 1 family protein
VKPGGGKRAFLLILCLLCTLLFAGLGVWQVKRLSWKLDLIARVDARVHAAPVAPPSREQWATLDPAAIEYRKIRVTGTFLNARETLVDALTELGPGDWVITPLRTADGVILVNRGFVPSERKAPATRSMAQPAGPVTVTGLLRLSEPNGRFLRPNRPGEGRWYSRDVGAIASARGLSNVAPFFIDADATSNPGGYPVGGLTVVHFRNAHLIYALTWFGLAALSLAGLALLLNPEQGWPRWTRRSSH